MIMEIWPTGGPDLHDHQCKRITVKRPL